MKMKWIALLPLAVVFAGLLVPEASLSCSCEPPGTPLEELALYDAVFTGEPSWRSTPDRGNTRRGCMDFVPTIRRVEGGA